jgi:hypothetical protein
MFVLATATVAETKAKAAVKIALFICKIALFICVTL